MAMYYVSGTDVPLREKVLKKSLSNTSTEGKGQSLSMFDNRTKVRVRMCVCVCKIIRFILVMGVSPEGMVS